MLTYVIVSIGTVIFIIDMSGSIKPLALWEGIQGGDAWQPGWQGAMGHKQFTSSRINTENSGDAEADKNALSEPYHLWFPCSQAIPKHWTVALSPSIYEAHDKPISVESPSLSNFLFARVVDQAMPLYYILNYF